MSALPVAAKLQPSAEPVAPKPSVPPKMTVQEYLEMERRSEIRHEYVDGEIIAMSGETPRHNRIAGNIYRVLGNEFEERPCEVYIEGVRVRVTPTQYRYPDVVAVCGEEEFDAENPPALLNPQVIVEVLSPSTEGFDREEKFMEYRQLPSVNDYVLVAQNQRLVVHYARQSPTQWALTEYTTLTDTLTFVSLEISLTLADIYRKTPLA